jgi:DoxX-like family
MTSGIHSAPVSKKLFWAGCICSALPVLVLLFSGTMKLLKPKGMEEGFEHLGWPLGLAIPLGILEVGCTLIYVIPRTSVLGAILLTGYLGGAIATHVRLEEAFLLQAIFGVLVWLGLFLRDARLRALLPLRT